MKQHWLRYSLALYVGDLVMWFFSLFAALLLRNLSSPSIDVYMAHALPFIAIFFVWTLIFLAFGLYDARVMEEKSRIPGRLGQALTYSAFAAVVLFYALPLGGIAPKFLLAIVLIIVALLAFFWRLIGARMIGVKHRTHAVMIGSGRRARELFRTVNDSEAYPIRFAHFCDTSRLTSPRVVEWVREFTLRGGARTLVLDVHDPIALDALPELYALSFEGVRIVEMNELYEDVYSRIPLESLGYQWLIENITDRTHVGYDTLKRVMDLVVAIPLFVLTTPVIICAAIAVYLEDKKAAFFFQAREGKNGRLIHIAKLRTMSVTDNGASLLQNERKITKIGAFLRKSRIDELPQLVNVIAGDLSLIGPRPEALTLARKYNAEIPYFNARNLITPGLSGWAQIHHEIPPITTEETRVKLAYDLYYLKHRSLVLDLKIALRTFRTIVSRTGR